MRALLAGLRPQVAIVRTLAFTTTKTCLSCNDRNDYGLAVLIGENDIEMPVQLSEHCGGRTINAATAKPMHRRARLPRR